MSEWRVALIVGVGGAAGALARWGVNLAFTGVSWPFPVPTLLVNLLGCLIMGLLVAVVISWDGAPAFLRPLVGMGFLGGFTTFSAFAIDTWHLAQSGASLSALAYVVVSVLGCIAAAWAGLRGGMAFAGRRR